MKPLAKGFTRGRGGGDANSVARAVAAAVALALAGLGTFLAIAGIKLGGPERPTADKSSGGYFVLARSLELAGCPASVDSVPPERKVALFAGRIEEADPAWELYAWAEGGGDLIVAGESGPWLERLGYNDDGDRFDVASLEEFGAAGLAVGVGGASLAAFPAGKGMIALAPKALDNASFAADEERGIGVVRALLSFVAGRKLSLAEGAAAPGGTANPLAALGRPEAFPAALNILAAALLAAWGMAPRFGRMEAASAGRRRDLATHLEAAGAFMLRHGAWGALEELDAAWFAATLAERHGAAGKEGAGMPLSRLGIDGIEDLARASPAAGREEFKARSARRREILAALAERKR